MANQSSSAPTDKNIVTSDVTTNNVSTSKHGFTPKAPNDATKYLDGTGAYSVPAGGAALATNALVLGTAAAAGVAATTLRSDDTIAAFDATVPTTQAVGDAAATGSAAVAARRDHKHAMPAFATNSVVLGSAAAAGSAATLIRSDGTIAAFDTTVPSTQAFGDAAAIGTAAFAARRDHKHAMPADPFAGTTAAAAIGGVIWTVVTKASDESVASSTTVQADDELFFTATSGGLYDIQFFIIFVNTVGGGTPDFKMGLGEDSTATRGWWSGIGPTVVDAAGLTQNNTDQVGVSRGTGTANRPFVGFGGHVGAGGTFRVMWAQATSDANATTVKAGSVLRYRRIL